jgi:uncharacterized protein
MVTRDGRWPAGAPCWVDVSVDDVPKAIAFYQALFGWDVQPRGPEAGGYAIAHLRGRMVAGIAPRSASPHAPSGWTVYLATDDADATADAIGEGRSALAVDTTGAVFGLWQGGKTAGLGLADEAGSLTWNEHLSWDYNAARDFYGAVFGYGFQDMSGFHYAMLTVGGREVGGIGRYPEATPAGTPAAWTTYFAVENTDAAVATAVELGGGIVQPLRDSPYGRIGVVTDNQGAVFSLITSPHPG